MKSQKELIKDKDWNILVILDACRYDYFNKVFHDFFEGDVKKCWSSGSVTPMWANKTFHNLFFDDTIYISANPWINSTDYQRLRFDAREHFSSVVDAWNDIWDAENETVQPKDMSEFSLSKIEDNVKKRYILHYIQPHPPYCNIDMGGNPGMRLNKQGGSDIFQTMLGVVPEGLKEQLKVPFIQKMVQKIPQALGLQNPGHAEMTANKYGVDFLRKVYLKNLERVLLHVNELARKLFNLMERPRVVISADHGHFLGEKGLYDHMANSKEEILRTVPWAIIGGVK